MSCADLDMQDRFGFRRPDQFTRDIAQAQAALLGNDYTLGQALHNLAKFGNRSDLFAAMRAGDTAEVGRIFMGLMESELRFEAVRVVAETLDETSPVTAANVFADCPRPVAIRTGD